MCDFRLDMWDSLLWHIFTSFICISERPPPTRPVSKLRIATIQDNYNPFPAPPLHTLPLRLGNQWAASAGETGLPRHKSHTHTILHPVSLLLFYPLFYTPPLFFLFLSTSSSPRLLLCSSGFAPHSQLSPRRCSLLISAHSRLFLPFNVSLFLRSARCVSINPGIANRKKKWLKTRQFQKREKKTTTYRRKVFMRASSC